MIRKPNHKKTFKIDEIDLVTNLGELDGKDFMIEQINGFVGVAKLLNYCLHSIEMTVE